MVRDAEQVSPDPERPILSASRLTNIINGDPSWRYLAYALGPSCPGATSSRGLLGPGSKLLKRVFPEV